MTTNPLQKYFRQPKIFISLPSKGLFYKEGSFAGDHSNVPIFAMTGMDEILMKTPDALFNGEATIKTIESCCSYIKDAHTIPSLDIDVLLTAIRIATFGEEMSVSHTCRHCGTINDYDINLTKVIEHYTEKTYNNRMQLNNEITINFRPLNYQELTDFNLENFKLQRLLGQLASVTDEEKQKYVDEVYEKLGQIQAQLFISSIESVEIPDTIVSDKDHIREWLANSNRNDYALIKSHLEKTKDEWAMPKFSVKCNECGTETQLEIGMDQSNFFA